MLAIASLPAMVGDASTALEAHRLVDDGQPAQVTGAQVHLAERMSGSEAPRHVVDGVHVMFEGGPWLGVVLDGVVTHEVDEPFPLHYRVEQDGRVVAMADQDLDLWVGGGALGLDVGYVILVVGLAVVVRQLRRRDSRRGTGSSHTGVVGSARAP